MRLFHLIACEGDGSMQDEPFHCTCWKRAGVPESYRPKLKICGMGISLTRLPRVMPDRS